MKPKSAPVMLDRLRVLESAATPAPWIAGESGSVWNGELSQHVFRYASSSSAPADAELVAAARNALPALLDIAEAAHRVLAPGAIVSVSNGTRAVVQTSQALADLGEAVARLDGRAPLGGDA